MQAIIIIEYIFGIAAFIYLSGFILAWFYELRINKLYRRMQQKLRLLEKSSYSMAVFHVKEYKIVQDYRQKNIELEKARMFILGKVLFLKKVH